MSGRQTSSQDFRKPTVVMDPQGKGVFLTGGAQGLGRGTVDKLLSLGAKVRKQSKTVITNGNISLVLMLLQIS